jgi:hypothetical protein
MLGAAMLLKTLAVLLPVLLTPSFLLTTNVMIVLHIVTYTLLMQFMTLLLT